MNSKVTDTLTVVESNRAAMFARILSGEMSVDEAVDNNMCVTIAAMEFTSEDESTTENDEGYDLILRYGSLLSLLITGIKLLTDRGVGGIEIDGKVIALSDALLQTITTIDGIPLMIGGWRDGLYNKKELKKRIKQHHLTEASNMDMLLAALRELPPEEKK